MHELIEEQHACRIRALERTRLVGHRSETEQIRTELTQLVALLDDAGSRLTTGFESLAALANRQHSLLIAALLEDGEQSTGCSTARGMHAVRVEADCSADRDLLFREVERTVSDGVTALQFHDIATQIVAGIRKRLARVDALACSTSEDSDAMVEHEHASRRPNPVTQTDLAVGSVELF